MFLHKYIQMKSLLLKPDGLHSTVIPSSIVVRGKIPGQGHPSLEHVRASLPRRRHESENSPEITM